MDGIGAMDSMEGVVARPSSIPSITTPFRGAARSASAPYPPMNSRSASGAADSSTAMHHSAVNGAMLPFWWW